MADESFPTEYLRLPLIASMQRDTAAGFNMSDPAAGQAYVVRTTFDTPTVFNLRFALEAGKKRIFNQWFKDKLDDGLKPFNIPIEIEAGLVTQEARFTAGGIPQVTSVVGNIFYYSASIIIRKLTDPDDGLYDDLIELADLSPCKDPNRGLDLLDTAVNINWPE